MCGDGDGDPPDVVMASAVTAAANPELVAAFDHVVFVDPPFDGGMFGAVLGAVAPHALVHVVWGESEVQFTQGVVAAEYELHAACRRVYRSLAADGAGTARIPAGPHGDGPGDNAAAVEARLLDREGLLAKLPTVAAAWRTLSEAGLLADGAGKKGESDAGGKADLAVSVTYRLWHERFHTTTFLKRCLNIRL